jgi:hypothetical protein
VVVVEVNGYTIELGANLKIDFSPTITSTTNDC